MTFDLNRLTDEELKALEDAIQEERSARLGEFLGVDQAFVDKLIHNTDVPEDAIGAYFAARAHELSPEMQREVSAILGRDLDEFMADHMADVMADEAFAIVSTNPVLAEELSARVCKRLIPDEEGKDG